MNQLSTRSWRPWQWPTSPSLLFLKLIALCNIVLFLARVYPLLASADWHRFIGGPSSKMKYTYLGGSYPILYPRALPRTPVALTLYDTSHFQLNTSTYLPPDPPSPSPSPSPSPPTPWLTSHLEWQSLATYPLGFGRTRLGPPHRVFVLVFYHQLHCLWKLQLALQDPLDPEASPHHVTHCVNYLRQTVMCNAQDGLEEGDFLEGRRAGGEGYREGVVGDSLVCWDWEWVYGEMDKNHERWLKWREVWN